LADSCLSPVDASGIMPSLLANLLLHPLMSRPTFCSLKLALALATLAGCAAPPLPVAVPEVVGTAKNACLPEAIVLAQTLKRSNIDARILLVTTAKLSHATVVYVNPPDSAAPGLWVWDSDTQSIRVNAPYDNPVQIARAWLDANNVDDFILKASFL
jgi:hypothetical protein